MSTNCEHYECRNSFECRHRDNSVPRAGSMLRWDDTPRYEPGFRIGSEDDTGAHLRNTTGWPYSVYRIAAQIGVSDVVICHGIQDLDDAKEICERLQCFA